MLGSGLHLCWSTPVFLAEFENTEDLNSQLTTAILEKEKEILLREDLEFQSTLLFNKFSLLRTTQKLFQWNFECINLLSNLIERNVTMFLQEHYTDFQYKFTMEGWANIHRLGDWHGVHSHFSGGAEIISGVYWVKVPNENLVENSGGKLILFDPRGPFFPERKKIILEPREGKLILFPSWLQHEVTPVKSNDIRISVAFDIKKL